MFTAAADLHTVATIAYSSSDAMDVCLSHRQSSSRGFVVHAHSRLFTANTAREAFRGLSLSINVMETKSSPPSAGSVVGHSDGEHSTVS